MESIVRETIIAAPPERVWALLTRPEHLRVWYAFDGASVDLRPDGVIEHYWKEHGRFLGVIDEVSPPRRLSYRYSVEPDAMPVPGRCTYVVFELAGTEDGGTKVTVTESGFETLTLSEAERRAHRESAGQGWAGGLEGMRALAEQLT
ncbi:SRPBCC domain-containing protein [Nocardia brasiliensis]